MNSTTIVSMLLIQSDPMLDLSIIVGGTHLSSDFGLSLQNIEEDGFQISTYVNTLTDSDTPVAIAQSMSMAINGFAKAYYEMAPDLLLKVQR